MLFASQLWVRGGWNRHEQQLLDLLTGLAWEGHPKVGLVRMLRDALMDGSAPSGTYMSIHHCTMYAGGTCYRAPQKDRGALSELDEWTDGKHGKMTAGREAARVHVSEALARVRRQLLALWACQLSLSVLAPAARRTVPFREIPAAGGRREKSLAAVFSTSDTARR